MTNQAENLNYENNEKPKQPKDCSTESDCSWSQHFSRILNRVQEIIFNPKNVWKTIKEEQLSLQDLYKNYLITLAAIPAVCGFLGMVIFGLSIPFMGTVRPSFFPALINQIVQFGMILLCIYIGAVIIEKLAPKFAGTTDTISAAKLLGFSLAPGFAAGVLSLVPSLSIIGMLLGLYFFYLYLNGISHLTTVPEDRKVGFYFVTIVAMIIVFAVVGIIIGMLTPNMFPAFDAAQLVPENVDMQKMEEGMKQFGDFMNKMQQAVPGAQ